MTLGHPTSGLTAPAAVEISATTVFARVYDIRGTRFTRWRSRRRSIRSRKSGLRIETEFRRWLSQLCIDQRRPIPAVFVRVENAGEGAVRTPQSTNRMDGGPGRGVPLPIRSEPRTACTANPARATINPREAHHPAVASPRRLRQCRESAPTSGCLVKLFRSYFPFGE
jgi:hypothetical protein